MRLIEIENALLLIPLNGKSHSGLDQELQQWQSLTMQSCDMFPSDKDEAT